MSTITLLSYPSTKKVQTLKIICKATDLQAAVARDLIETLPARLTFPSLEALAYAADAFNDIGAEFEGEEAPSVGATPRDEIDIITDVLGRARATVDLLVNVTATTDGAIDELDEATLNWSFHDIRDRIDQAKEAAEELHDKYWALKHAAEVPVNGGAA